MVVALIVVGVIVFLAVDGYVIYRWIRSRTHAQDYGAFQVPGELTITLSPGQVRLRYQEGYRAQGELDHIYFDVPAKLEVTVTSPSGQVLEIKRPGIGGHGAVLDTGKNWTRALVGTVEVVEPGDHTVAAGPALEDAIEPQVLVGK
jgi:hypothetical protein